MLQAITVLGVFSFIGLLAGCSTCGWIFLACVAGGVFLDCVNP